MSELSQRMQRTVCDMKHYDVILDIHEFIHTRKTEIFWFFLSFVGSFNERFECAYIFRDYFLLSDNERRERGF